MAKSVLTKIIAKHKKGSAPLALNLGSASQRSDDKDWFQAHPRRFFHVREVLPDEFPGRTYGAALCAVLRKERDGRRKMPVFYPLASCQNSDDFLLGFWNAMLGEGCPGTSQSIRDGWLLGCMNKGKLGDASRD